MTDRISSYRQVRLVMNVTRGEIQAWDLHGIVVRRGIPTHIGIDSARFPHYPRAETPEDLVTAVQRAGYELDRRWTLL